MNLQELERLEAKAMDQTGKFLATPIAITPGTLLELCRLARIGHAQESQGGEPA